MIKKSKPSHTYTRLNLYLHILKIYVIHQYDVYTAKNVPGSFILEFQSYLKLTIPPIGMPLINVSN